MSTVFTEPVSLYCSPACTTMSCTTVYWFPSDVTTNPRPSESTDAAPSIHTIELAHEDTLQPSPNSPLNDGLANRFPQGGGASVGIAVAIGVAVAVGMAVAVGVEATVGEAVCVGVGTIVAVGVAVAAGVQVAVAVGVGVPVDAGVAVC